MNRTDREAVEMTLTVTSKPLGLQVAVSMAASLALVYGLNYAPNSTAPSELARYVFDAVAWAWAAPAWMFSKWAGALKVLASFFNYKPAL
ncbi:MAG TPA: hypothetical protein GX507_04640 [Clostridia bacterium]|nr:hypothetical protein [Clostridia bacterium]